MPEQTSTPSSQKSARKRTSARRQGVRLTREQRIKAQDTFLKSFAAHGNVRAACIVAGIDRSTVRQWEEHETVFSVLYNQAKEDVNDAIRAEIFRRAIHGDDELVVSMGKIVYGSDGKPLVHKRKSDILLMFHAKARMPEYRDKQPETMNSDNQPEFTTEWSGGRLELDEEASEF